MKSTIQVAKIGNSQGIRLSKRLLGRYGIEDRIELETTPDGIILRPLRQTKLSWSESYKQMAESGEDWSEWEAVAEDGIVFGDD